MKLFCETLYSWIEIDLNDQTLVLERLVDHGKAPNAFQKSQYRNITHELAPEFFRGLEMFLPHLSEVYEYTRSYESEPPTKLQRRSADGKKGKKKKKTKISNNKNHNKKKSK
jgi:hypothetical protein